MSSTRRRGSNQGGSATTIADALARDVNEKDIDVSLVGDQLTIKGEKRSEHEEKKDVAGHLVHRTERSYGAFQRTLTGDVVGEALWTIARARRSPPRNE